MFGATEELHYTGTEGRGDCVAEFLGFRVCGDFVARPDGEFGSEGARKAGAQLAVDLSRHVRDGWLFLPHGHDGETVRAQSRTERIAIPAEEVVGRIIERVLRGLPAISVGNAENDKAARTEASAYFGQEGGRIGLMFEDIEEGNDIEELIG